MTPSSVADALSARGSFSLETFWDKLLALLQAFRPPDGWLSVILLGLNLAVVVWSVQRAEWVPTPSLVGVVLLAMITGLLLSRIPIWAVFLLPVGLAIGALVVVWQLTSFQAQGMELASAAELWQRLGLWYEAARDGTINIDQIPFAFGLVAASWLSGFLAGWVFFRYRNFWGVFILGGAGILANLTYLPDSASAYLGVYLLTALLLVGRVLAVRRRQEWERRNFQYDSHLGMLSMTDTALIAMAVLLVAFLLPVGRPWQPANSMYEFMRAPAASWEEDFNRLFAGLPARRPLPYRIWGDVIAFQGTINPTTTPVLQVDSPVPMYWKARTYGHYTPKGWVSSGTVFKPTDWTPTYARPHQYRERSEVTYMVTPNYQSRSIFAGGQVLSVSQDALIETYDSPAYVVDLTAGQVPPGTHPKLAQAVTSLESAVQQRGPGVSNAVLTEGLPEGLELINVTREGGEVQQITLVEVISEQPDTLSVRSAGSSIDRGQTYEITSSISRAEPDDLRRAGSDYPIWAVGKYTQLPDEVPQRVRELAARITAGAETPYDKAKAVEEYLKATYTYNLSIDPPPFNADGVDFFLFEQREGYSEYFGSAMTVLLRTQGIPARLATGYTVGDKVASRDVYVVNDSHSHAWSEVYFPGYGWVPFEPTPGAALPVAAPPAPQESPPVVGTGAGLSIFDCIEDDEFCDEDWLFATGSGVGMEETTLGGQVTQYLPWALGFAGLVVLLGSSGWFFWRRYLTPSGDPDTAFRRLAFLGSLSSVGPSPHQTPYQYLGRLAVTFPEQREPVSEIVNSYVRSQYGKKELTTEEREGLIRAWLRVRLPLLFHIFSRRTGGDT
jgi:hypothetical protein